MKSFSRTSHTGCARSSQARIASLSLSSSTAFFTGVNAFFGSLTFSSRAQRFIQSGSFPNARSRRPDAWATPFIASKYASNGAMRKSGRASPGCVCTRRTSRAFAPFATPPGWLP